MFNHAVLFDAVAAPIPNRECGVRGDRRVTCAEPAEHTNRLGNVLQSHGVTTQRPRAELRGHESGQPTLVVHGTDDPIVRIQHGGMLAASIPGARIPRLEGMGHSISEEYQEEIVRNVFAHTAAASTP